MKHALVAFALALAVACGGGGSSSGNPNTPGPPSGSPGPSGATITISNGAVSPSTVTINPGESVTFVNNDNRGHEISSDPHPAHSDCPAINALVSVAPGQTKLTNALTTSRTCGFHDHNEPTNAALQGRIIIR